MRARRRRLRCNRLRANARIVAFSEVCKALNKNRGLYGRWNELQDVAIASPNTPVSSGISVASTAAPISREELDWTTTELRKALRSIEWDLDDLEDTIYILCHCSAFHSTQGVVKFVYNNSDTIITNANVFDCLSSHELFGINYSGSTVTSKDVIITY